MPSLLGVREAGLGEDGPDTGADAAAGCVAAGDAPSWRNPKHRQQWTNTLAGYAYPVLGDLPVAAIDLPHILKVLEPIWTEKTETASRLRGRIEAVLDWATVRRMRQGDNAVPGRHRGARLGIRHPDGSPNRRGDWGSLG